MDLKKQEIENYYRKHLTSDYKPAFYHPRSQRILEFLKNEKKSTRILDIGCEAGDLLLMLKEAGSKNAEGLDYSVEAKNFAEKRGLKVTLFDFEKEKIKYSHKFDFVICADVLEYIFDPGKFLEKIKLLLLQDGKLILAVSNAGWWLNGILSTFFPQLLRSSPVFGFWTNVNQFTFFNFKKILGDSGFGVAKITRVPFVQPKPPKEGIVRKIVKFIFKLPIKFTNLFSNFYLPIFSSYLIVLAIQK